MKHVRRPSTSAATRVDSSVTASVTNVGRGLAVMECRARRTEETNIAGGLSPTRAAALRLLGTTTSEALPH